MSYIQSNLLNNEQVVYQSHLHWIIFMQPFVWPIIGFIIYEIAIYTDLDRFASPTFFLLVPFVIGAFSMLMQFITYISTEFGVTNQRVIMKMGFISRRTYENMLGKIENLQIEQSVLGRILNYGTVIVHGTGGTRELFPLIDDPLAFRRAVQEQIEIRS